MMKKRHSRISKNNFLLFVCIVLFSSTLSTIQLQTSIAIEAGIDNFSFRYTIDTSWVLYSNGTQRNKPVDYLYGSDYIECNFTRLNDNYFRLNVSSSIFQEVAYANYSFSENNYHILNDSNIMGYYPFMFKNHPEAPNIDFTIYNYSSELVWGHSEFYNSQNYPIYTSMGYIYSNRVICSNTVCYYDVNYNVLLEYAVDLPNSLLMFINQSKIEHFQGSILLSYTNYPLEILDYLPDNSWIFLLIELSLFGIGSFLIYYGITLKFRKNKKNKKNHRNRRRS